MTATSAAMTTFNASILNNYNEQYHMETAAYWQRMTEQRPGFKGFLKKSGDQFFRHRRTNDNAPSSRVFRAVPLSQARMHKKESTLDK